MNENGRRLIAALLDEHVAVVGETTAVAEVRAILTAPDANAVRADMLRGLAAMIRQKIAKYPSDPKVLLDAVVESMEDTAREMSGR